MNIPTRDEVVEKIKGVISIKDIPEKMLRSDAVRIIEVASKLINASEEINSFVEYNLEKVINSKEESQSAPAKEETEPGTVTLNEWLDYAKSTLGKDFNEYSAKMFWFKAIDKKIKSGGTITKSQWNDLDGGMQFSYAKDYGDENNKLKRWYDYSEAEQEELEARSKPAPAKEEKKPEDDLIEKHAKKQFTKYSMPQIQEMKDQGHNSHINFEEYEKKEYAHLIGNYKKLKTAIDDKDFAWLSNALHTRNDMWRAYFTEYTGIKLPNTERDTITRLKEFTGYTEPKPEPKELTKKKPLVHSADLNKQFNYGKEGVMSRKEFLDKRISAGYRAVIEEEINHSKVQKKIEQLSEQIRILEGNWGYNPSRMQQLNDLKKERELLRTNPPTERRYLLKTDNDSAFWELIKTEYDYAMSLTKQKDESAPAKDIREEALLTAEKKRLEKREKIIGMIAQKLNNMRNAESIEGLAKKETQVYANYKELEHLTDTNIPAEKQEMYKWHELILKSVEKDKKWIEEHKEKYAHNINDFPLKSEVLSAKQAEDEIIDMFKNGVHGLSDDTLEGLGAAYRKNEFLSRNNQLIIEGKMKLGQYLKKWDEFIHNSLQDTRYKKDEIIPSLYFNNRVLEKIKEITGVDIETTGVIIDADHVRHIRNRHGSTSEYKRGQIPVFREDYLLIPKILIDPDSILRANNYSDTNKVIEIKKVVDNAEIYIIEAITKYGEIVIDTMYKKPVESTVDGTKPPSTTSDNGSIPSTKIQNSEPIVKENMKNLNLPVTIPKQELGNKEPVSKNKTQGLGTLTPSQIKKKVIPKALKLRRTRDVFGMLLPNPIITLAGAAGSGKSTYSLKIAEDFAENGKVLFLLAEEGVDKGYVIKRLKDNSIKSDNIEFVEISVMKHGREATKQQIIELLNTHIYKFVFIDSINYLVFLEVFSEEELAALIGEYNDEMGFVLILQMNKDKVTYKGAQFWEYNSDVNMVFKYDKETKIRTIETTKNRGNETKIIEVGGGASNYRFKR
ncbi:MAG: hypothetical protein NT007_09705 [Candidatus Kapabacteria bacterium]|nr:hypothetical protein [Candidatus Kapabacteria bacterium]